MPGGGRHGFGRCLLDRGRVSHLRHLLGPPVAARKAVPRTPVAETDPVNRGSAASAPRTPRRGYGLGVLMLWIAQVMSTRPLPGPGRTAWRWLTGVAAVAVALFLYLGSG